MSITLYDAERDTLANNMVSLPQDLISHIQENYFYDDNMFGPMGQYDLHYHCEDADNEDGYITIFDVYNHFNGQLVLGNVVYYQGNFYCEYVNEDLLNMFED